MSGISQAVALWPDRDPIRCGSKHTCDVLVQNSIFFNHIVDQPSRCAVENQHFPLKHIVRSSCEGREGFEVTDVAMGDLSDGGQDDCTFVRVVQQETSPVRALTVPLGIQDRDHGGRRWADGRVTMLAERL
jgi:hypothetical protein